VPAKLPGTLGLLLAAEAEAFWKVETTALFSFGFLDLLDMLGFFAAETDLGAATASGRESRCCADHQAKTDQEREDYFFHCASLM